MRGYVGGRAWKDNFVEFNVFRLSRSLSHGIWLAITPSWDPHCLHGIWNKQRPLRRIENETTGAIVPHLEMLASTWLDPDCVAAVRISSTLYLVNAGSHPPRVFILSTFVPQRKPYHLRISDVDPDPFTIDLTALKLIIGHVEHVAQMHVSDWRERFTLANGTFFHLAWGQDEEMAAQKHTKNILDVGLRDRRHVAAIIRLMRTPGPFEGGSDYIFEKYMKVAVSLLYENGDIHFIEGTDCLTNDRLTSPLPLLIAGGSSDLSKKVQASFAAAARNTLVKLVRNHNEAGPSALALPEEFIVYGLHWSNARLHILAHFVTNIDSDDPDKWKFCQVLVAQHWITLEEVDHRNPIGSFRHYAEFDMLLDRWRVVVSLFMIRAHVQRLKQCLQTGDTAGYPSSEMGFVQSSEAYLGSSLPIDIGIAWRQPLHEYVCELHGFWRGSRIYVPAEWIPAEHEQLDLDIDDFEENVRPLMVSLAKLALSPLRPLLAPMDKETVVQNDQRMDYKGPRQHATSFSAPIRSPHDGDNVLGRHQHFFRQYFCKLFNICCSMGPLYMLPLRSTNRRFYIHHGLRACGTDDSSDHTEHDKEGILFTFVDLFSRGTDRLAFKRHGGKRACTLRFGLTCRQRHYASAPPNGRLGLQQRQGKGYARRRLAFLGNPLLYHSQTRLCAHCRLNIKFYGRRSSG
ncbi:unnamed protein product [Somion occarium]|uniref:Uncharacterized protein n=1 Tax=Somion occarium TaxID=3059160 RepID=A0ABP1DGS3_9APHY